VESGSDAHQPRSKINVATVKARILICGFAILALGPARPLHAQMEIGTWVRKPGVLP
jgi:hypothetical protein